MERRAASPSSNSFSDTDSYEESNSIDEVEATLNNLDDELDETEQALSTWSSQTPSTGYGSHTGTGSGTYTGYTGSGTYTPSGTFTGTNTVTQTGQGSYTGSPSFVSLPSLFSPTAGSSSLQSSYPPPSNAPWMRLSHITERTEGTESRPVSGVSNATSVPVRPRSAFLSSGAGRHSRSSTDPSDLPPPGRANQLIGLFESGSSSRSPSPTKSNSSFTRSQTPSNLSYSTLLSPPDRPFTATGSSYTPSTFTNTQSTFTQSTFSPSAFTTTQTGTGTVTGFTGSSQETQTTPTSSSLRRPAKPEGSPRSPLTNVRNIVSLWKERTPTRNDGPKNSRGEVVAPSVSPTPDARGQRAGQPQRGSGGADNGGLFELRRRASGKRASAESLGGSEGERTSNGSNGGSIDISELGKFLGGNGTETPLHLGTLYYLNVHAEPPYRWQRCQALLYRHTLLLSWLAPTTQSVPGPSTGRAPLGRAVVQLDLVNCFAVESALSLSHPRARDDVGAIAAREQDAGADTGLMESLVPFWMVYGDGVERLACDSLVQRLRWIERIWEAINTPPTPSLSRAPSITPSFTPSFSSLTRTITRRSGSPTGSIRTILSMDSNSSVSSTASSGTGSRSTVYVPPMSDIPDIPELSMAEDDLYVSESDGTRGHSSSSGTGRYHSLLSSPSVSSSGSGARLRPSTLISSYHSRTVDDTVIDGDEYVYPGDSRAIPSRRTSTRMSLRRSGSMTDLGSDALQSNRSSGLNDESDDQFFTAGTSSSAPRNLVYSSAESYSSQTGTGTGTRTFTGLTSSGITGTGTTDTYTRTGTTDTYTRTGTTDTYTRTGTWTAGGSGTQSGTTVTESTRYTGYTRTGTGVGTYTSYSGSGSYTGSGSDSYAVSGPNSENRSATTGVTGTGRTTTDYESRTGYGSATYSGSPYTGTGSIYSPYTGTTGSPYTVTSSSYIGTGSPYTSTATYSSPYTRSSTSSSYPPTSPSRSALNRTAAMRRRTGTTRSYSSSGGSGSGSNSGYQPSEESNDKENDESESGSYTPASGSDSQTPSGPLSGTRSSETGYDVCPSSDLSELTSRMTYTSTSWMSGSTPMPSDPSSSSSDSDRELSSDGEKFVTASQGSSDYLTTRTPSSEASFKSLPSIPSEYTTASEGSIAYKTISEPVTEPTTAYSTAEICPSELETIPSEGGTPKAYSEHLPEPEELPSAPPSAHVSVPPSSAPPSIPSSAPPSIASSAPPSIASSAPPSIAPSAPPSIAPSAPPSVSLSAPASTPPSAPLSIPPSAPPSVSRSVPPSLSSLPSASLPLPTSTAPPSVTDRSISSPSSISSLVPSGVPLPSSAASELSELDLSLTPTSESDLPLPPSTALSTSVPTPSSVHWSESRSSSLLSLPPTALTEVPSSIVTTSLQSSSSTGTLQLPTTLPSSTMSSLTISSESSLTPSMPATTLPSLTLPSIPPSSSPSSLPLPPSPQPWATETNISYESSLLAPSPSATSVALIQDPDTSFETSFLRPSGSWSSFDRMSTIPETPTAITSTHPPSFPALSPIPSFPATDESSSVRTPSSLIFSDTSVGSSSLGSLLSLPRTPSTISSSSAVSSTSVTTSLVESESDLEPEPELEHQEDDDARSIPESQISTEPSLLSSIATPRASRIAIPGPRSRGSLTPSERSMSVSISTPRGDTPSKRSTLDTVPTASTSFSGRASPRDVSADIERLAEELRQYDQNRAEENRDLGDALRDLREELLGLSDSLHHPIPSQEPPQAPSYLRYPRQPQYPHQPQYPQQPPYPQQPYTHYAEERVGSSRAMSADENRSLSLAPSSLNRTPSSASSVSFLSSHHSDDWLLYPTPQPPGSPVARRSIRPDSPMPTLPDIDESELSSESSSPLSTPMLSSSSTSGPYPGSSGPSSSPTPTPPPSTVTPISVSPGSPATTATTIRPSPPNPLPLLNEIRDQVRALWEGQLSTNHLLDEIRGLRSDSQSNEVLDRMRRVENLLEGLLNQGVPVQPPPMPVPEPSLPPASPSMSSSSAGLSRYESLINDYRRQNPPIAPVAQPPASGTTLAQQLEEILSQGIQPRLRQAVPPEPLQPFDYAPLPRAHADSPIGEVRLPPPRATSQPIPFPYPDPRRTRVRRHPHRPVDESPASRFAPTAPSGPSSERPDYQMGDAGRQPPSPPPPPPPGRRPTNIPPPQVLFPRSQTAPPLNLGGDAEPEGESWYRRRQAAPAAPVPTVGVPPPGVVGPSPATAQPAQPAQPGQSTYVPMPSGPVMVQMPPDFNRDLAELLELNRNNALATLTSGDQTRELLRYMTELNLWLGRDVTDRHNEMTAVVQRLEELRASLNDLRNRPYVVTVPGDEGRDEETEGSSEGSPEQQPVFIPGMPPSAQAAGPGMPQPVIPGTGPWPPGFVPQGPPPFAPSVIPGGGGPSPYPPFQPVIPGMPPGMPSGPIVVNPPGPAPIIPMDFPHGGGMRMPEPMIPGVAQTGQQIPFIPPGPSIVRVPGSSSSSSSDGDSGSSRSGSSDHTRRPSRRPSTGSYSRSPTPVPIQILPPTQVPGVVPEGSRGPSPPVVVVQPSEYPPPGSVRHPDLAGQFQPSQASQGAQPAGPTIINIPAQPQQPTQVPGMMPGGIVPPGMIPGGLPMVMPGMQPGMSQTGQPPVVVVQSGRSSPSSSSGRSSPRSMSDGPSRRRHRTDSRSRTPPPVIISQPHRTHSSHSPHRVEMVQPGPAPGPTIIVPGAQGTGFPQVPTYAPTQPVQPSSYPPTQPIIYARSSSSRSRSSSGHRRTPPPQVIVQPSQPGQPLQTVLPMPTAPSATPAPVIVGSRRSRSRSPPIIIAQSRSHSSRSRRRSPSSHGAPIIIPGQPTVIPGQPSGYVPSQYPGTHRTRRSPSSSRSRSPPYAPVHPSGAPYYEGSRHPSRRSPPIVVPIPSQYHESRRPSRSPTRIMSPRSDRHRRRSRSDSRDYDRPRRHSRDYDRPRRDSRDRPRRDSRDRDRDRSPRRYRRDSRDRDRDRSPRHYRRSRSYSDSRSPDRRHDRHPRGRDHGRDSRRRSRSYSPTTSVYPGAPPGPTYVPTHPPTHAPTIVSHAPSHTFPEEHLPSRPGTHRPRSVSEADRPEYVPSHYPSHAGTHRPPSAFEEDRPEQAPSHYPSRPGTHPPPSIYEGEARTAPRTARSPTPGSIHPSAHSGYVPEEAQRIPQVTRTRSPRTVRDDDGRTVLDDDGFPLRRVPTVRDGDGPPVRRTPTGRTVRMDEPEVVPHGTGPTLRDDDGYSLLDDDGRPLRAGPPIIPASRPGTVRPLPSEPSGRGSPSIIETVPPPRARTPRTPRTPAFEDLALAEEQRDRLARLDEAEHRINDVVESARESEQQREAEFEEKEREREDEFRMSEQDRDRIFRENEEARAREAAEARDALLHDLGDLGHVPPSVPPAGGSIPGVVVDEPGDRSSIHTIQDIRDTASRHAQEIREIIDLEREENTKEREAAAAERLELEAERNAAIQAAQELKDARIQELEEQVAALRAELEAEKEARQADESDARERERAEREEHNEFIRSQLMDLTNLMNEQRQVMDEKKELMESRYAEKEERRRNKDAETAEMRDMIQRLFEEFQAERDRAETLRMEAEGKPGVEKILEDVMRRHDEIQEALRAFSDTWRNECEQHHAEIINAVRETANEQVPYNIQGYLDEFSKALASEVRILLGEVGKLREERRALQHEIGYLLCMRSKYGPGGEFEPDWKPPPGAPGGPPVEPPPPPEPPVPPEIPPARPGWRTVHQRSRKKKEKAPPPAPGPSVPAITGMVDPRTQVTRSWATWQPDPNLAPTPASIEPTLLIPDRDSPGLFGARSPRDSRA